MTINITNYAFDPSCLLQLMCFTTMQKIMMCNYCNAFYDMQKYHYVLYN